MYITTWQDCLQLIIASAAVNTHDIEFAIFVLWLAKILEYFQLLSKVIFTPKAKFKVDKESLNSSKWLLVIPSTASA